MNATHSGLCPVSRAGMEGRGLLSEPKVRLVNVTIKEIAGDVILVSRTSGIHTDTLLGDEAIDVIR